MEILIWSLLASPEFCDKGTWILRVHTVAQYSINNYDAFLLPVYCTNLISLFLQWRGPGWRGPCWRGGEGMVGGEGRAVLEISSLSELLIAKQISFRQEYFRRGVWSMRSLSTLSLISIWVVIFMVINFCHSGPGLAEGDENCKKFMDKTLPDAFFKVSQTVFLTPWITG